IATNLQKRGQQTLYHEIVVASSAAENVKPWSWSSHMHLFRRFMLCSGDGIEIAAPLRTAVWFRAD
ncbi:hypothetical protein, partial [Ensifer sp.]|uniref:hypothetical protein n=1 Tax=Ensifer sp. TaxID=1872086 RepID=UPI002E0F3D94|nr:hypothetical protein [Ensifer sp.]